MTCRDVRLRLAAHADEELGIEAVLEVEAHLERCTDCRDACRGERDWRSAVASLYPREPLPPSLEARVLGSLRTRRGSRRDGGRRIGRTYARRRLAAIAGTGVAAALLIAAGAAWLPSASETRRPTLVDAAVTVHGSVARGDLRVMLDSSSLPTVNRWLARELPFFAPVRDGSRDFELRGASAVDLAGERAAFLAYRRGREAVSLFVLPMRSWAALGSGVRFRGIDFHELDTSGHRVIAWSHEPVSYLLVSTQASPSGEACAVCHLGSEAAALTGFAAGTES